MGGVPDPCQMKPISTLTSFLGDEAERRVSCAFSARQSHQAPWRAGKRGHRTGGDYLGRNQPSPRRGGAIRPSRSQRLEVCRGANIERRMRTGRAGSPVLGDGYTGFGNRPRETGRSKGQHRPGSTSPRARGADVSGGGGEAGDPADGPSARGCIPNPRARPPPQLQRRPRVEQPHRRSVELAENYERAGPP